MFPSRAKLVSGHDFTGRHCTPVSQQQQLLVAKSWAECAGGCCSSCLLQPTVASGSDPGTGFVQQISGLRDPP
ncbi:hypothetical protein DOTSEDRAFT_69882 [Dothistroma septosporum NZE10]|uniref:Uncharacterized protein n=1 Tax=Dothistroma septosporum (strain NZE10 / CBS 128990) TaxID=675120 RepID=N1Q0C7_DOTSN|nr:hypothetical protein DOTSEDRAFT_69882 [Dothistroma septosporum NZE10]